MTPFADLIFFATISIQMVVVPSISSGEEIGGVSKVKVQVFLKKPEYINKIVDMFTTTRISTDLAKQKILQYSKTKLPEDLKKLLGSIANAPNEVYEEMAPLLKDLKDKAKNLDEKLESESLTYRMIGKPAWGILSGLGYMGLSILGYSVNSLGTLAQLFSNGAKEGVAAYNDGKLPDGQTKQVFHTIEDGVHKVKGWGNKIGDHARGELQKGRIRRMATNTIPRPEKK